MRATRCVILAPTPEKRSIIPISSAPRRRRLPTVIVSGPSCWAALETVKQWSPIAIRGVRCALCWNVETARLARAHNNANALSLGQRMLSAEDARMIVQTWLTTPFEGGRHRRRIQKIDGAAE